jgi:hypothetical protein
MRDSFCVWDEAAKGTVALDNAAIYDIAFP